MDAWQVDPLRLERMVANLVENGQRHGGGVVRLSGRTEGDTWVIEVDDQGPGVPHEERDLVFHRFGRGRAAHARGGHDGTGLGLAIVAQHAQAHGGHAVVVDRPGGGSRFVLLLPVYVDGMRAQA